MTLTVERCAQHIRSQLGITGEGSEGLSAEHSILELVNMAGQWLVQTHEWHWLMGPEAELVLALNQTQVALPANLKTISSIDTPSITSMVKLVTLAQIQARRKSIPSAPSYYEAAVEWVYPETGGGEPLPALAVYPAITEEAGTVFTIFYRRRWVDVVGDNAILSVPWFCEMLFLEAVRALAAGWHEFDNAGLSARLQNVRLGDAFASARKTDGQLQPSFGVLTNGMAEGVASAEVYWRDRPVPGPS